VRRGDGKIPVDEELTPCPLSLRNLDWAPGVEGEKHCTTGTPMRNPEQIKAIAKAVHDALAEDFNGVKIVDVKVYGNEEFDGDDDFLRIAVIFEGRRRDVDTQKLSGAIRQVRPALSAIGENAFPLLSFISNRDAGAGNFEPA
jgi:hypothetical protein